MLRNTFPWNPDSIALARGRLAGKAHRKRLGMEIGMFSGLFTSYSHCCGPSRPQRRAVYGATLSRQEKTLKKCELFFLDRAPFFLTENHRLRLVHSSRFAGIFLRAMTKIIDLLARRPEQDRN